MILPPPLHRPTPLPSYSSSEAAAIAVNSIASLSFSVHHHQIPITVQQRVVYHKPLAYYLTKGSIGNFSNCTVYPLIYVTAFANRFGPANHVVKEHESQGTQGGDVTLGPGAVDPNVEHEEAPGSDGMDGFVSDLALMRL
ncbi:hypothetical protein RHMOL_Rhmol13G0118200 [Rhododendron molle]|uniref:Uncharacterized protein n=2 Tax=Rhododendron molle TaxID=49168 RepID=A0ACC0L743_RHOML|nr:hypothetical protein RHMOL_Rhmol13G0118200 [Rhododendron molle]KAI8524038.1 hypothetical protein RHMOL_Rhmol13G0118200 [Rhododendron molle]